MGLTPEERGRLGELPQGRGLLGIIQHEGKPLRLDDIAWDPHSSGFPPMKTFLGMPIVSRGRVVGDLYLTEKEGGQPFSEEDQLIIEALAADAAMAIENAWLYGETRRAYAAEETRRQELDALYGLSRQLVATDEMEAVLDSVACHAVETVHVTFGRILTLEDGAFVCRAAYPVRQLDRDLCLGQLEPSLAWPHYQRALSRPEAPPSAAFRSALALPRSPVFPLAPPSRSLPVSRSALLSPSVPVSPWAPLSPSAWVSMSPSATGSAHWWVST